MCEDKNKPIKPIDREPGGYERRAVTISLLSLLVSLIALGIGEFRQWNTAQYEEKRKFGLAILLGEETARLELCLSGNAYKDGTNPWIKLAPSQSQIDSYVKAINDLLKSDGMAEFAGNQVRPLKPDDPKSNKAFYGGTFQQLLTALRGRMYTDYYVAAHGMKMLCYENQVLLLSSGNKTTVVTVDAKLNEISWRSRVTPINESLKRLGHAQLPVVPSASVEETFQKVRSSFQQLLLASELP